MNGITNEEYKRRARKNEKASYEDWLSQRIPESDGKYYAAVSEALTRKALSSPTYGSRAERLSGAGLSRSGYEQYLEALASRTASDAQDKAQREREGDEAAFIEEYRRYEEDYDKEQERKKESAIALMAEKHVFDSDRAYKILVDSGLSEENARISLDNAVSEAKAKTIRSAAEYVKALGMSSYSAKNYARSLGLSEREANAVLKEADRLTKEQIDKYQSLSAQEYFELLESLSNRKD